MSSTAALAPTLVRNNSAAREFTLVLGGVALLALSAQIVIPLSFTPVPITGQTFGALLVGGALGSSRGAISLLSYLLVGVIGVPVFADGASGWVVLSSATGGYLVGMVIAGTLVGAAADHGLDRRLMSSIGAMLIGSAVVYLIGATWLAVSLGLSAEQAFDLGVQPFIVGDLLKLAVAGSLLSGSWTAVAQLSGPSDITARRRKR